MSTAAVGQPREPGGSTKGLLRRVLVDRGRNHVWERQGVEEKLLVLLPMRFCPLRPGLFPGEVPAFFSFEPLMLADLFFDQVGDPIEGVGLSTRSWIAYLYEAD